MRTGLGLGVGYMPSGDGGEEPSETYVISGAVKDANGDPYLFTCNVLVYIAGTAFTDWGVITSDGTFVIDNIPSGTYDILLHILDGLDTEHVDTWHEGAPIQSLSTRIDINDNMNVGDLKFLPSNISLGNGDLTFVTHMKTNETGALTLSGSDVTAIRDEEGGDDYELVNAGIEAVLASLNGETAIQFSNEGITGGANHAIYSKDLGTEIAVGRGWLTVFKPTDTQEGIMASITASSGAVSAGAQYSTETQYVAQEAGIALFETAGIFNTSIVYVAWDVGVGDDCAFMMFSVPATDQKSGGTVTPPSDQLNDIFLGSYPATAWQGADFVFGEFGLFELPAGWSDAPLAYAYSLAQDRATEWGFGI